MPRLSQAATFEKTISQLVTKREEHVKGLAEIDALCERYGITLNGKRSAATATQSKPSSETPTKRHRKRRRFGQTANEFLLDLLKTGKNMVTSEINAAWKKSGRGGAADNALGMLVKAKKVKRAKVKDGRGSSYSVT